MASNQVTITVPQEYGYVLLTTTATFFLAFWQGLRVGPYRRAAKIPYPMPYAFTSNSATKSFAETDPEQEKASYLFNCAQRAHHNYLENQPTVVPALLIAGLKYPIASSVLGAAWCINRWVYAVGYTRHDKERGRGRVVGLGWMVAQVALMGLSAWTGWLVLRE